jgi:acyl-coenzyme A thioesterase PaaI-like protein
MLLFKISQFYESLEDRRKKRSGGKMEVPELHLEKIKYNPMCFGCGKENPHSLKMSFFEDNGAIKAEFMPTECHQSWPGHVHGGALMTALDEGIGRALFNKGIWAVTAKIEIKLKSMARIGEPLIVSTQITRQTSRTVEVEAQLNRRDSSLVAEAKALFFKVK